ELGPNESCQSQSLVGSGRFRLTRGLTLTGAASFASKRSDTSRVAVQSFSTGRQESWSNTFGPGMTWQMTPRDSLSLNATYGVLRYLGAGTGADSDTYGFQSSLSDAV